MAGLSGSGGQGGGEGVGGTELDGGNPGLEFLSRSAKQDASRNADKGKGSAGPASVDPANAWGKRKGGWPKGKPRPNRSSKSPAEAATEEIDLQVKGPPDPPRPAPKPSNELVNGWAGVLYLGHICAAAITRTPELTLSTGEAEKVSIASINVLRHFAPLGVISEKMQDISAAVMVAGAIYVPRMQAASVRKAAAKAASKTAPPPPGMNAAGGYEQPASPTKANEPLVEDWQPNSDDFEVPITVGTISDEQYAGFMQGHGR
jgi:hypothetical protein